MSEKTEEPTDKKLDDAKRKGQGPKSQDIVAGVVLVCSLLTLIGFGPTMFDRMSSAVRAATGKGMQAATVEEALAIASSMFADGLLAALPMVAVSVVMALVAVFSQVGSVFSTEAISPKFEKLNPAEGFKKLISVRSLIEVAKAIVKAIAIGAVIWLMVRSLLPAVIGSAYLPARVSAWHAWQSLLQLVGMTCIVFAIVGPVDFGLQKWLFKRDNKMSKDDIKREYKEAEGDPQLKGERKQLAREMATSAPQQRVPGATVVVTNPTHYAVALLWVPGHTPLPVIVAKGMDEQAAAIRALATAHNVPIVANPPLARALHQLPLNMPIPEALFEPVSVVLRWVEEVGALGSDRPAAS